MPKQLKFQNDAREAMLEGMNIVADAVCATFGPRGQTVVLSRQFGPPLVTKDGVTVARDIVLADRWQNEGAKLIQEVAQRTNTEAGDGTTAATALARALFAEGQRRVAQGADRRAIERGMHLAVDQVVKKLKEIAKPVTQDDLETITAVATIAANGDETLGRVIAECIQQVGLEGVITLDQSPTTETTKDVSDGLQFDKGFIAPVFMANRAHGKTIFENCNVFVTDRRMIDDQQMAAFLQAYLAGCGKSPLLIVCEDCEGAALQLLAVNNGRAIDVVPVRTPGAGASKKEEIEDIAIFCGAKPYMVQTGDDPAKLRIEDLGSADRVIVTPFRTTIIGGHGQQLRIDTRKDELRSRLKEPNLQEFAKAQLERRLALLSASIAVIRIGASIHSKLLEKRDRVEDSVNATLGSLKEGVVPGGGTALIRCMPGLDSFAATLSGDERVGAEIVSECLSEPLSCIASNAGVDADLIIDCVWSFGQEIHLPWWARLLPLPLLYTIDRSYAHIRACRSATFGWGYNAADDAFQDMVEAGIIDPVKVVRLSLQNAAELAGLLLTCAALAVEFPDGAAPNPGTQLPPVVSRS